MNKSKQLSINMIATMLSFVINTIINFLVAPYIINTLGSEAYGFVTLANNFVNYASLVTVALNSVAGRFITIKLHKNEYDEMNEYFNTTLFTNYFASVLIFSIGIPFSIYLDSFVNIPSNILIDVKMLFIIVITNFSLSIIGTTYAVSTFARNRLDLSSIRNVIGNILKVIVMITLFVLFKPKVFFVGFASMLCTIYILISNKYYTKKLLPEVSISIKNFSFKKVIELMSSGIWNTITKLGQIMIDGLDLLISNIFINSVAMGQLSVPKMFGGLFANLLATTSSVFQPQLITYYAKDDKNSLIKELKFSMKITGFFSNIPLMGIAVFGGIFYKLWIPKENINIIYILTILTLQGVFVSGIVYPLFNVYTLTNRLKLNSLTQIISGILNVIIVFLLLKITNLGIYIIAGTSTIIAIIRNLTFTPMYSAYCLNISKKTFYPIIFRYVFTSVVMLLVFNLVKKMFINITWSNFLVEIVICVVLGLIINFLLLLNKNEQSIIMKKLKRKRR